jgi:hypothetical protein
MLSSDVNTKPAMQYLSDDSVLFMISMSISFWAMDSLSMETRNVRANSQGKKELLQFDRIVPLFQAAIVALSTKSGFRD